MLVNYTVLLMDDILHQLSSACLPCQLWFIYVYDMILVSPGMFQKSAQMTEIMHDLCVCVCY